MSVQLITATVLVYVSGLHSTALTVTFFFSFLFDLLYTCQSNHLLQNLLLESRAHDGYLYLQTITPTQIHARVLKQGNVILHVECDKCPNDT